jgi:hypothetical protein
VNIVSLRCLTLLFEFDLPSFKNEELVDSLRRGGFIAMNNHCYRTSSDTEMSNATFKVCYETPIYLYRILDHISILNLVLVRILHKISRV